MDWNLILLGLFWLLGIPVWGLVVNYENGFISATKGWVVSCYWMLLCYLSILIIGLHFLKLILFVCLCKLCIFHFQWWTFYSSPQWCTIKVKKWQFEFARVKVQTDWQIKFIDCFHLRWKMLKLKILSVIN